MTTIAEVARAFIEGRTAKCHNARTNGTEYVLHRTTIARKEGTFIEFNWGGWWTPTTTNHMNAILTAAGINKRVSYAQARDASEYGFVVPYRQE